MNRIVLSLIAATLVLATACKSDTSPSTPAAEVEVADEESSAASAANEVGNTLPAQNSSNFDYLTGCDSMLVDDISLASPTGDSTARYARLICASNKSYELLLVPRDRSAFPGDASQVLATASQPENNTYIPYVFQLPKLNTAEGTVETLLPANVTIFRKDGRQWIRLGIERVEDDASLKLMQWKITQDRMPTYQ